MTPSEYFSPTFNDAPRLHLATFNLAIERTASILDEVFERALGNGSVHKIEAGVMNWSEFRLSKGAAIGLEPPFKVVIFETESKRSVLISSGPEYLSAKIAWKSREQSIVWDFDAGRNIRHGNYYCGFECYENGAKQRIVRIMMNDDGRWEFYASGDPLPEEDVETYRVRSARKRLDYILLLRFAKKLGYSFDFQEFWNPGSGSIVYEVRDSTLGRPIKSR